MRTVCGSEFQTDGAEDWKARLEKSVPVNGLSSSGMADERKVRLQVRSAIRRLLRLLPLRLRFFGFIAIFVYLFGFFSITCFVARD